MPRFLDIIVPPIFGTNFAGNGDNDAVKFLKDNGRLADGFNSDDVDFLLERKGSPTNQFDALALNHDLDRINPDGSTRSGFDNIRSDLDFALGHCLESPMGQLGWQRVSAGRFLAELQPLSALAKALQAASLLVSAAHLGLLEVLSVR